jgi:anaerobic magnesium-protoporphyrin IX monomethyl ester cyclase
LKILLINPPRENEIIGNNPSIIEEERGHNPPLGLLYVAAYAEKHSNYEIAVIDAQVEAFGYQALEERIRDEQPSVVGITAMTLTLLDVMKTVATVKRISPSIKVVLGGPHVHLFPEETMGLPGVDFLVMGEGEEAFKDLLDNIDDKAKLRTIPGFAFKDGEEYVHTGMRPPIEDLDSLPFPARKLVPYRKYSSLLAKGNCVTTIFTSRGCPFKCSFCDRPHLGARFRARSAENVVAELEECVKLGITEFLFYDDTFTVDKQRAIDVCSAIISRKLNIGWDIRTRVDTVNEDVIKSLAKAGCQGIHYGIEAGTQKILDVLQKGISLERVEKTFALTRRHGIPILAYFMIGSPNETREDISETFSVIKRLNPDYVHMTILTPFPGTRIYADGLECGVIKSDVWREFARKPTPALIPPHWGAIFTREELATLLIEGYRSFYLRPGYILKRLLRLRSFSELKKKAMAGIKVLHMK